MSAQRGDRWTGILALVLMGLFAPPVMAQQSEGADGSAPESEDAPASGEETDKPRPVVRSGTGDEALAAHRSDRAVWLETPEHGRLLALLEREQAANAKGAVLILADEGQSADTALAGALREPLSKAGWAALSMGLPEPPQQVVRARRHPAMAMEGDKETAGQEEPANEEADAVMIDVMDPTELDDLTETYRSRIDAYVSAALERLSSEGYSPVVLVGVGYGASAMARHTGSATALVWVAPQMSESALEAFQPGVPVLELYPNRQQTQARQRSAQLKRQQLPSYRQQPVAMDAQPQRRDAGQVANRMLSWLRALAEKGGR
ncbi:uncharacterized protein DUF3530 [Tamilnaduibacter salinus]|uniref:Uncharacterized protein DUF3530 n=1 Tax=Tamilnaduibacter salinus TaxID=1484056 RepID=A0A2U1CWT3_9GAMM|nr:DUF3530 family protein [Tamilnaduibacter salinus]PVY76448.1 uncharacterized protein DUF3530 [Tamilnaduibacter salinus]